MGALRMPFQQVGHVIVLLAGAGNARKKQKRPIRELNVENARGKKDDYSASCKAGVKTEDSIKTGQSE